MNGWLIVSNCDVEFLNDHNVGLFAMISERLTACIEYDVDIMIVVMNIKK